MYGLQFDSDNFLKTRYTILSMNSNEITSGRLTCSYCRLIFVFLFILPCLVTSAIGQSEVHALINTKVKIPCKYEPEHSNDAVVLILWYRENISHPIYSLDARGGDIRQGRRNSHVMLGKRVYLNMQAYPPYLQIDPVEMADTGIYRCRVDFRRSPTVNYDVNLLVIVPTNRVKIKDKYGNELKSTAGPFIEQEPLVLICESFGGNPLPSVMWFYKNKLLDDTSRQVSNQTVRNELLIKDIKRSLQDDLLTCIASNTNLTKPIRRSVAIHMYLKPTSVHILDTSPIKAGQRHQILCKSSGSKPPARITWWLGNKKLLTSRELDSDENLSSMSTTTTSVLMIEPTSIDDGKYLSCRAENPHIAGSAQEDGYKLQVHFIPTLSLEIVGKTNQVPQGQTVYFDCHIQANPWITNTGWKYNGEPIQSDLLKRISIGNQSLVLNRINRQQTGSYSCTAENSQGTGESNPIKLTVEYAPVCVNSYDRIYGVALDETANVVCQVHANPPDVSFRWTFNSSSTGRLNTLSSFSTDGTKSVAFYMPRSEYDYGQLYCYGKNSIGSQSEPCIFDVIRAGRPQALRGCYITNREARKLTVHCQEGFNGGMRQYFIMEVYDRSLHKILANITSNVTKFTVNDLPVGSRLQVIVYAYNSKGRSDAVSLFTNTLYAEKNTSDSSFDIISPALTAIVIVVCCLLFVAALIVIVVKIRSRRKLRREKENCNDSDDRRQSIAGKTDSIADSNSDKKSPDLIPSSRRSNSGDIFHPEFDSPILLRVPDSPITHFPCEDNKPLRSNRRKVNQTFEQDDMPGISSITPSWNFSRTSGPPTILQADNYDQNHLFRSSNIRNYVLPPSPSRREHNGQYFHVNRDTHDDDSGISSETPLMTQKVESAV